MFIAISFILTSIIFFQASDVFAAAAIARQQQMKQAQQQAQQQAIAQYQQAQQQAQQQQYAQQYQQAQQQQAQAQQQAYAQQYQQAQLQQAQAQQQALLQAVQTRRQQIMDTQNQYSAAVLSQQYQQAVAEEVAKQKMTLDAAQMAQMQQLVQNQAAADAVQTVGMKRQAEILEVGAMVSQARPFESVKPEEVKDVVDIADVWRKLDVNSRAWTLMIDNQAKVLTVSEYMERFRKQGIKIQLTPIEYIHTIDDMAIQNPSLLKAPFKNVLQLAAIMQYDFDVGVDKDLLARKSLGEALYQANKKRLGR